MSYVAVMSTIAAVASLLGLAVLVSQVGRKPERARHSPHKEPHR